MCQHWLLNKPRSSTVLSCCSTVQFLSSHGSHTALALLITFCFLMGHNHCHHTSSSTMNIETSTNHLPSHQHQQMIADDFTTERLHIKVERTSSSQPTPLLGKFLPPLLTQAKGGLSSIPQSTLHDNLQLVILALEKLDASALLDLETFSAEQAQAPCVRDG